MSFFNPVPSVHDTDGEYADVPTEAFVPASRSVQEELSIDTKEKP